MERFVAVIGSVTRPGRLAAAVQLTAEAARDASPGCEAEVFDLGTLSLPFADGRPVADIGGDTARIAGAIEGADAVLLASPVYRASLSGSLKNLLDLLPIEALMGKPVGILAMGATHHHYLGVDWHLRSILSWFGALVPPTSVYLSSADFVDGVLQESAAEQVVALVTTLAVMSSLPQQRLGPPPLAAQR